MPCTAPTTYRQLQPEGRVKMAGPVQQKHSIRAVARVLGRAPNNVSCELRRNTSPHGYGCQGAHFTVVLQFLGLRWSPEQITLTLASIYPKGHRLRVLHGNSCNRIYARPVGELTLEHIAALRHAHCKRVPRTKGQDRREQIPDILSIHVRPLEIEDRQFPGYWEGDLIKGAGNTSAVGTLVELTSRLLMFIKLPEYKLVSAANVTQAITDKLLSIAQPMRQTMPYDQGREMAQHKQLSQNTRIAGYFCDPSQPMAAGIERKHQRTGASAPAQGY